MPFSPGRGAGLPNKKYLAVDSVPHGNRRLKGLRYAGRRRRGGSLTPSPQKGMGTVPFIRSFSDGYHLGPRLRLHRQCYPFGGMVATITLRKGPPLPEEGQERGRVEAVMEGSRGWENAGNKAF